MFVNEPTKVIALKNIFKNAKVVSYCHWLAMDNMKEIELRQIEGIIASDIAFLIQIMLLQEFLIDTKA